MRAKTRRWIDRAEADYISGIILLESRVFVVYPNVCFLAQQSSEKYLKACLVEDAITPPLTHDLVELMDLLPLSRLEELDILRVLEELTSFGVSMRYPGKRVDRSLAQAALQWATTIRIAIRTNLGLDPDPPLPDPEP